MTRDLVTAVNTNGLRTFRRFAEHVPGAETREFGTITGVSLGLPAQLYNQLFVFEAPDHENLDAAVDWIAGRDVPFRISMPESLAETEPIPADELGLVESDDVLPGIAMPSLDDLSPADTDVALSEVTDSDALDEFNEVFSSVFGLPPEFTRRAYPESMLDDDAIRFHVGRIDGEAVACGKVVTTGDVAGVYSVGVEEPFRRRGIGEAMTREVLRTGRDAGCGVGTLQSTEMAHSLYQRMGFETVVEYHHYEPVSPSDGTST
jgi:ribosomal protein S18 acetylase RimI-like enzyme